MCILWPIVLVLSYLFQTPLLFASDDDLSAPLAKGGHVGSSQLRKANRSSDEASDDETEGKQRRGSSLCSEPSSFADTSADSFKRSIDILLIESFPGVESCRPIGAKIGALVNSVSLIPMTGVLRKTTRDLLNAPKSTDLGNSAVAVTIVSLLLPYLGQGMSIGSHLTHCSQNCRTSSTEDFLLIKNQYTFPVSIPHKILKGIMGVTVAVNSLARLAQMVTLQLENVESSEWQQAFNFVCGTGFFYFLTDWEMNYCNGSDEVDNYFFRGVYPRNPATKLNKEKMRVHIRGLKKTLLTCENADISTKHFTWSRGSNEAGNRVWKAGLLIKKGSEALDGFIDDAVDKALDRGIDDAEERRTDFVDKVGLFGFTMPRRRAADATAKILIGFGTWGRYKTNVFILSESLTWLGVEPVTAFAVAHTSAGLASVGAAFWEAHLHHTMMRKLFRCKEIDVSPDNLATRVVNTVPPLIGAGLFASSGMALGLKAFTNYPVIDQIVYVGSASILNFNAYYRSLRRRTIALVRPIATACRSRTNQARVTLMAQCDYAEKMIDRLTDEVIETFVQLLYGSPLED